MSGEVWNSLELFQQVNGNKPCLVWLCTDRDTVEMVSYRPPHFIDLRGFIVNQMQIKAVAYIVTPQAPKEGIIQ